MSSLSFITHVHMRGSREGGWGPDTPLENLKSMYPKDRWSASLPLGKI